MPPSNAPTLPGLEVFFFLLFMGVFYLLQLTIRRTWQLSLEGIWLTGFAALAITFYFRIGINLLLLTGVALGLLVLTGAIWLWLQRNALEVQREVPPELRAQQTEIIRYRLRNRSRLWLTSLSLRDQAQRGVLSPLHFTAGGSPGKPAVPKALTFEGQDSGSFADDPFEAHANQRPVPRFPDLHCFLRPREELVIEQPVLFTARGLYRLGPIEAWLTDPGGYHSFARLLPVWDFIEVLPAWTPLAVLPRELLSLQRQEEETNDDREGHSTEFRAVREYRPGDALKSLHWGLTAKHQRLMVRQYQQLVGEAWGIVVDCAETPELGLGADSDQERLLSLVASLAAALHATERPYVLVLAMQRPLVLTPLESGMDHQAVLRALAAVRFDRRTPLDALLEELRDEYPQHPWLLTTTRPAADVTQALESLRHIQPVPVCAFVDHTALGGTISAEERFLYGGRSPATAGDAARFVKDQEAAGFRCYHLVPETPLAEAFAVQEAVPDWAGVGSLQEGANESAPGRAGGG